MHQVVRRLLEKAFGSQCGAGKAKERRGPWARDKILQGTRYPTSSEWN